MFTVVHTLSSSGVFLTAPAVATPLERHHLAATFDGDTLRAFVDGALAAQAAWGLGSVYYGAEDVLIGAQNFGAGFLRRFDGFIDDVRVWDHARTPAQIATAMNCRLSGTEPGLVSYWTFDASDLSDATGHGHTGAVGGLAGSLTYAALATISSCAVGVERSPIGSAAVPTMSVFPQPTRGRITVRFEVPSDGLVTLDLFDVAGRKRAALVSRHHPAGWHELTTDITDLGATAPSAGRLFMRLKSEGRTVVRPLILLR